MATLRADIEKLEEAVRILCEILPQFDDLRSDVNGIASDLYSTWDGAASDYFVSKLRSHITPLRDTQLALEYFKDYAAEAKYNMKKLDEICQVISTVPVITIPQAPASSTNTSSSGNTHGGGGKTLSDSSNKKTTSSSGKKSSKNAVEKAIDAITKTAKAISKGVKTRFGGK